MTQLGKYHLVRKLAAGGMAEVYLARTDGPAGFSKTLVVKRILPHLAENGEFVEMFLNEARLAALLNHPNVIQIFELGREQGTFYLAMELVDGTNLRSLARAAHAKGERLPVDEVCKIVSQACEGLGYAHDFVDETGRPLQLVHRDISPDNLLLSRQGSVKVADFGIAKAANLPNLTKTGMLKGKINYMPPEQLRGVPLDKRADVFALGVVLHEALAGTKPFDNSSDVSAMQAILNEPPRRLADLRPELPEPLQAIVDKALAKDRDQRYPDCRSLQADLERLLASRGAIVRAVDLANLVNRYVPPEPRQAPAAPAAEASEEIPIELSLQKSLLVSEEEAPVPLSGPKSPAPGQLRPAVPVDPTRATRATTPGLVAPPAPVEPPPAARSRTPLWIALSGIGGAAAVALVFSAMGPKAAPAPAPVAVAPVAVAPVAPAPKPVEPPAPKPVEVAAPTPAPVVAAPEPKPAPTPEPKPVVAAPTPAPEPAPVEKHHPRPHHERPEPVAAAPEPKPAPAPEPKPAPVVVQPVAAPAPAPEPSKPGTLSLRVQPWAEVEIDGQAYGVTPIAPVTLIAGEHKVRLKNAEVQADRTLTVTIRSGAPETLRINLAAP